MKLSNVVARLALTGADDAFEARLRGRFGLTPAGARPSAPAALGYCGREFRVYPSMRVGEASRFYAALHDRWNAAVLRSDLERTGLGDAFEVRRMKRAYQRALVLAMALAAEPSLLVVEGAEEFDEAPAAALLERALGRVSRAIVTYGGDAQPPPGLFTQTLAAGESDEAWA